MTNHCASTRRRDALSHNLVIYPWRYGSYPARPWVNSHGCDRAIAQDAETVLGRLEIFSDARVARAEMSRRTGHYIIRRGWSKSMASATIGEAGDLLLLPLAKPRGRRALSTTTAMMTKPAKWIAFISGALFRMGRERDGCPARKPPGFQAQNIDRQARRWNKIRSTEEYVGGRLRRPKSKDAPLEWLYQLRDRQQQLCQRQGARLIKGRDLPWEK